MPRALDPDNTYKIVLETDKDKPEDKKPAFIARVLTEREWRPLATFEDCFGAKVQSDAGGAFDGVLDNLMSALEDWENMIDPDTGDEIEFSRENLRDVLTAQEMMELQAKIVGGGEMDAAEKKGPESQLPPNTDKSATPATPQNAETIPEKAPTNTSQ